MDAGSATRGDASIRFKMHRKPCIENGNSVWVDYNAIRKGELLGGGARSSACEIYEDRFREPFDLGILRKCKHGSHTLAACRSSFFCRSFENHVKEF